MTGRASAISLLCAVLAAPQAPVPRATGPEILWDTWGIPHIYAADDRGLAFAFGWAQAQAHGDLLLRLLGESRARAAEYWGEAGLEDDRWLRTLDLPAQTAAAWDAQSPAMRSYLTAFAEGINAYATAHADRIADSVQVVLPVVPTDVLAQLTRVSLLFVGAARAQVEGGARRWREAGSNGWAIGPGRSASGNAMLLANPHLPWRDEFTWFEAQLVSGNRSLYGAALVGFPVLPIAFNDRLGWTHTTNTQDETDHYELTLVGDGYRWEGRERPFEESTAILKVRRSDGSLRDDTIHIRRSVHGPVVAERPGKAIALRVAGLDRPRVLEQWLAMGRARSLTEFERAARTMQLSSQNIIYADADGHILYHYGGNTPIRATGDRAFWSGVVPGDTSATLWADLHPYEAMPRVIDPPSGWVQNANEGPWSATFPPVWSPSDYPSYLAPLGMAFRPQRSVRMLDEDTSITFEELIAYKHSTRMELADRVLDDLLPLARAGEADLVRRAAQVLERWDRSAEQGSPGAVLFDEWWRALTRRPGSPFATRWSPAAPRTTPDGLADPLAAVVALEAAARRIEATYGALHVAWGDVHRLKRDAVDLPGNGGSGGLGVFRTVSYDSAGAGRMVATGGDSFVAAVEFGTPVRAMALVGYGNWSQPGSPHRTDQLALFARKALRPVWLTRQDIEAHLERREQL